MSDEILLSAESGVATISINRPKKKNALTAAMYGTMTQALQHHDRDDSIGVVVLQGGQDFTAGNDLLDFVSTGISDFSKAPPLVYLRALHAFSKPVVAAVRGVAIGIGTTMLLHADVVLAGESAKFGLPFVKLALVPEAAATLLLPNAIGLARAKRYLMTGESFSAQAALEMGLISEVLPDAMLESAAMERAAKLAALPSGSLRETKRLLKAPIKEQIEETMAAEARSFAAALSGDEFRAAALKLMHR
ncbi:MAG: enoyl-CoA hydratase-related protein [Candidatus Baltobacteraceae bacterium]